MSKLPRVPTLQHLARMVDKDPAKVEKHLWQLVERSPYINYVPSQPLCKDRLRLGVSDDHVLRALASIKGDRQRKANLQATSAFLRIAPEIPNGRFIDADVKHFALGRNVHVPVNPFLYQLGVGGNNLLWTSFWANLALSEAKQAFFWTILELTFFRSPDYRGDGLCFLDLGKQGGEARFFYCAKADGQDRLGSSHPTVKPINLMQWLVRLVTPKDGLVLDPFAGTGTTGEAAFREGMRSVLIERETSFYADIQRRISLLLSGSGERSRESVKEKIKSGRIKDEPLPLFMTDKDFP